MRLLKNAAYQFVTRSRLTRAAARLNRTKALVLAYHDVSADPMDFILNYDGLHVCVQRFEAQMRYLAAHYRVVALDELLEVPGGVAGKQRRAAITIDDGYRNTFQHAYPILRRLGLPATLFIATDRLLDGRPYWWDRLRAMVAATRRSFVEIRLGGSPRSFFLATVRDKLAALHRLTPEFRRLPAEAREAILAELAGKLEVDAAAPPTCALISVAELCEMVRGGISVGSHGCSHESFLHFDTHRLREELTKSRQFLEAVIGRKVSWLSYPHGEFSAEIAEAAGHIGYLGAVTTIEGLNDGMLGRFSLRRIGVNDAMNLSHFMAATSGLRDGLKALLHARGGQSTLPPTSFEAHIRSNHEVTS